MSELRIKNTTLPKALAASIHAEIQRGQTVTLLAMGVAPVAIGVKAVAVANGLAAPQGSTYSISPSFVTKEIDGKAMTVVSMRVVARPL